MKINEITIEDFSREFEESFLHGYNQYCQENNLILEGTNEGEEIRQFVLSYQISPIIDSKYYFLTLGWSPAPNHKYLTIANIVNEHQLVSIEENGQIIVKNMVTGQLRKFPEVVGPVTDSTKCSVLFTTAKEKDSFLFMLKFKFSDWKIVEDNK